ncbi:TonB-dependent receptor [Haliea sp. E1-2-M8]|uniref:TonB-dependent receptor n=1 Tax=Haliea sp. E1-2-M8 TaxID=3064706 RepID=UPI00271B7D0C|nr:TonB-dependent receptor [Haliea sp. E1-2-M8]MDO8863663.1 TonB-dependent receptor [Haliea sp. E1-2-M8]
MDQATHRQLPSTSSFRPSPLVIALRRSLTLPLVASSLAIPPAFGQESGQAGLRLEEVVVTAQKRTESLQDVPISVQALGSAELDRLNISGFSDYVQQLPSVSFTQRRPGQASLFMRGVSEGGNGNQSLQGPSVAIYLDNQPVTAIGFNLDPHIYDVERIEVLMGPQGTLYGAASQAGTLRIVTKKPSRDAFEAGVDFTAETISGGGNSYLAEGYANIPLNDRMALRVAAWWDDDGGYIDAVEDTITYPLSGITRGNAGFVEDDFNEVEKRGLRAALGVDLSDRWSAVASVSHQRLETNGIWDHDPEGLGDFKVGRFFEDSQEDEWTQFALTVEGDLGFADLTYAGSYLDREFETYSDYSHYSIDGFVEPYYTCYVSYFGPCVDPSIQYSNLSDLSYESHELRLASSGDNRLNWVAGVFYSEVETAFESRWSVPPINPGAAVEDDLYFQTDQVRVDKEKAIFGELYYDLTEELVLTLGYRRFKNETTLDGFVGTIFWPDCCYGYSSQRPPDNVASEFDGSDGTGKVSLAYNFSDDIMVYGTVSEGYRPGGVNRAPGVGETYQPDFLTSYELGWKTELQDGRLRINGAVYHMEWDDVQIGFFNPDISLLGLVDNVGAAESTGLELDATWLLTDSLDLMLTYSRNNAELTEDYFARSDATAPDATDGQDLPFTPDTKYTITGRYHFPVQGFDSTLQLNWTYTDEQWNDIFASTREKMDSYGLLNASWRIEAGRWHASLFGSNLTDEVAELYINSVDIQRLVTVNQPRTFGVSFGMNFN